MEPESHEKILGIDYGERRIGTAVSDGLFLTAQPLETINYHVLDNAVSRIKEIVRDKKIQKIVVGIPLTLHGKAGHKAEEVAQFISNLKAALPGMEIQTWDERLTTSQAEKIMIDGGSRRSDRKLKIDTLAAAIMLQSYMDYVNLRQSAKHEIKR